MTFNLTVLTFVSHHFDFLSQNYDLPGLLFIYFIAGGNGLPYQPLLSWWPYSFQTSLQLSYSACISWALLFFFSFFFIMFLLCVYELMSFDCIEGINTVKWEPQIEAWDWGSCQRSSCLWFWVPLVIELFYSSPAMSRESPPPKRRELSCF